MFRNIFRDMFSGIFDNSAHLRELREERKEKYNNKYLQNLRNGRYSKPKKVG